MSGVVHQSDMESTENEETSDDEGTSEDEGTTEDEGTSTGPQVLLESFHKLAKVCVKAKYAKAFARVLANVSFADAATKRRSETKDADNSKEPKKRRSAEPDKEKEQERKGGDSFTCGECDKSYRYKASLKRHVVSKHMGTDLNWQCIKCNKKFNNKSNVKRHLKEVHNIVLPIETIKPAKAAEGKKSGIQMYKCTLCKEECSGSSLYKHYGLDHGIACPEEILFNHGTVLVYSDRNTKNGTAPWFVKERERAKKRYTDVTCRFCENLNLEDEAMLEKHYIVQHKVEREHYYLETTKHLFRADKHAHLVEDSDNKECDQKKKKKSNLKKVSPTSEAKQSGKPMCKCTLCNEEFSESHLYKHYGRHHDIEFPEEILFNHGKVLVLSDRDTVDGTAPWFVKEREKAKKRYTNVTCRFCEYLPLNDAAMLEKHYIIQHKVDRGHLATTEHLFRAGKRAHLDEVSDNTGRTKCKDPLSMTSSRESDVSRGEKRAANSTHKGKKVSEKEPVVRLERVINTGNTSDNQAQKLDTTENTGPLMYICKCGVATTSYDRSVEHAQRHVALDYRPITNTCNSCELVFEAPCFAEHESRTEDCQVKKHTFKRIDYDYTKLLTEEWVDMFKDISRSQAKNIVSSSLYYHTRCVKINWSSKTGVPLYRCGMCRLFVNPEKVDYHCKNHDTCTKNKPKGYRCLNCDISFFNINALEIHNKDHGTCNFRVVTFNNKDDKEFNKALEKNEDDLRRNEEDYQGANELKEHVENPKIQERREQETTDYSKIMQYCDLCKMNIRSTDYDAHQTEHVQRSNFLIMKFKRAISKISKSNQSDTEVWNIEKGIEIEEQVSQNNDHRIETHFNERDTLVQNTDQVSNDDHSRRMEIDEEEPFDNRSVTRTSGENKTMDNPQSERKGLDENFNQGINTTQKNVQVDIIKSTENLKYVKKPGHLDSIIPDINQVFDNSTNQEDILDMTNQVSNDIVESPEILLGKIHGITESPASVLNMEGESLSTQDLLSVLESEATEYENTAKCIQNNQTVQENFNNEVSQDMFIDKTTENRKITDDIDESNPDSQIGQNKVINDVSTDMFMNENIQSNDLGAYENDNATEINMDSNRVVPNVSETSITAQPESSRISSRDIIRRMIPEDDSSDLSAVLEEERNKREFERMCALVSNILSSRD